MISTVAVGTDGSATATEAVRVAVEMARRFGAKLVLVSAFQDSRNARSDRTASVEVQWAVSPAARVKEILARTEEELGREGIECSSLVDEGNPADVLVIGNRGIRRRVLGSVPNSVTHNAPCSVFVVKTT